MEIILTNSNFEQEVLGSDKPVLVDFWATWCGPCRMLAPTVEAIAEEKADVLKVGKVDVDQEPELARRFGAKLRDGDVVAYRGGMGMGKTHFTRGIAEGMGITQAVSSPTFAIVNEYRGGGRLLCHFDMYRIEGFDDLYSTGFFDYLDSGAVLVIEWSENIIDFIGDEEIITVDIKRLGDNEREISVERGEG
jgi:tRNA threonylcarbamoyladenosine biosynthesis protein TsaE